MIAEHRGRAMGTDLQIVVAADDHPLLAGATAEIDDLELRWSRFLATSEVSQLNRRSGRPMIVSQPTFDLVAAAVDGWDQTEGRFDPTVHDALVAHGYDRSFTDVADIADIVDSPGPVAPTPGVAEIVLDPRVAAITLPAGVRIDLGGIGKGAAADAVTASLLARGSEGACVSLGGDVRVGGVSPIGSSWPITVQLGPGRSRILDLVDGAVCTSTRTRRRWSTGHGPAHHLIEPSTGSPVDNDLATVTVCAADAIAAEILTKSAFLLGRDAAAAHLADRGLDALLIDRDGQVVEVGRIAARFPDRVGSIPRFG